MQFLAEVQRGYFQEMRAHLRALGLHCPVTAVVSNNFVADVATVAQECDFTAENWYGEGLNTDSPHARHALLLQPQFTARRRAGRFRALHRRSSLAEQARRDPRMGDDVAQPLTRRVRAGSPGLRQFAGLRRRTAVRLSDQSCPERRRSRRVERFRLSVRSHEWGLYALAGQAFLSRAIAPADHVLTYTYTPDSLSMWPNNAGELYRAAWSVRLNNVLADSAHSDSLAPTNASGDLSALKQALNAVGRRGAPVGSDSLQTHIWRSDTKQITRNGREGRLEIQSKTLAVIAGEFTPERVYSVGKLPFHHPDPFWRAVCALTGWASAGVVTTSDRENGVSRREYGAGTGKTASRFAL